MGKEKDRLFTPLSSEPYEDFKSRGKLVEVRKVSPNFNRKTVYVGRRVELRKGYSGESINGVITHVLEGTLKDIFDFYGLEKIEPRFNTIIEAIEDNEALLGIAEKYIGFEISFSLEEIVLQPKLL